MKKTLLAIVTILFSLLVCLGAMEAALRLKNSNMRNYDIEMWRYSKELKRVSPDPLLGHEHVPNASAVLQSVQVRTNERGLRGPALEQTSSDTRKVMFIGGSVTLGWGVKEGECVTQVTEMLLRGMGEKVVVLNAGIGNYNAARYVRLFLTRNKDLEPTDIVVHYLIKDAEVLKPEKENVLLASSQLAATVWMGVKRLTSQYKDVSVEAYHRAINDPQGEGYGAMRASLAELATYAKSKGIRVYLAIIPDLRDLQAYPMADIHANLAQVGQSLGFVVVDMLPSLAGLGPNDIFVMPGDPHPNAHGHALMAKAIAATMHRSIMPVRDGATSQTVLR